MSSPSRKVPILDELNRGFWTGGRENQLRLRRCANCRFWVHPPRPVCPRCWARELPWEPTSGRATLYTFTINHKAWNPEVPTPYVIGMVELEEQVGLRMSSNIVNCAPEEVHIGMPLRVLFEHQGDHFIPLFEPDSFGHMP